MIGRARQETATKGLVGRADGRWNAENLRGFVLAVTLLPRVAMEPAGIIGLAKVQWVLLGERIVGACLFASDHDVGGDQGHAVGLALHYRAHDEILPRRALDPN